jgi:hypothetical protein
MFIGSAALFLAAAAGVLVATPRWATLTLVVVLAVGLLTASVVSPKRAVPWAIAIAMTAGTSRRVLEYVFPSGVGVELLVIVPAAALLSSALVLASRHRQDAPGIAKLRMPAALSAVFILFVFAGVNPGGAGVLNNFLTSALFLGGASLAFVLYRGWLPYKVILIPLVTVGVLNSGYIVFHELWGAPAWDLAWAESHRYNSIFLGPGLIRPLGVASSVAESAAICGTAAVACFALIRHRAGILLAPLGLLCGYALLLTGVRTYFITALVAMAFLWAMGRKHPIASFVLSAAVLVPAAIIVAGALANATTSSGVARVLNTVSGREDLANSSIPIHVDLLTRSLERGVASVIGTGSGQIGILATEGLGSADTDLGNVALIGGLVGVVVCAWLWVYFLVRVPQALRNRGPQAISVLILVATFTQWFTPNQYGMTPVVWGSWGAFALLLSSAVTARSRTGIARQPKKELPHTP